jgi:beta-galactosidase
LTADRKTIKAGGNDLSFVTVTIADKDGNMVPDADNLVRFTINGNGKIAAVDNGSETSMESFRGNQRKAFNGLCLAVIQSTEKNGAVFLKASADGLQSAMVQVLVK